MQEKLTEIAQKRIEIIEKGSLQVVREIEDFYLELNEKIKNDNQRYSEEKLPKLLEILEKYDENSHSYKLYFKRIEDDMDSQLRSYNSQIEGIAIRQEKIGSSFLASKEKMSEQTAVITNNLIEKALVNANSENQELIGANQIKSIDDRHTIRLLNNEQKEM
jgi:hypothetical protein